MDLIEQYKKIRKEQKISQRKLAKMVGVYQQSISKIEQGKNVPSLYNFEKIINILGYEIKLVKINKNEKIK